MLNVFGRNLQRSLRIPDSTRLRAEICSQRRCVKQTCGRRELLAFACLSLSVGGRGSKVLSVAVDYVVKIVVLVRLVPHLCHNVKD